MRPPRWCALFHTVYWWNAKRSSTEKKEKEKTYTSALYRLLAVTVSQTLLETFKSKSRLHMPVSRRESAHPNLSSISEHQLPNSPDGLRAIDDRPFGRHTITFFQQKKKNPNFILLLTHLTFVDFFSNFSAALNKDVPVLCRVPYSS